MSRMNTISKSSAGHAASYIAMNIGQSASRNRSIVSRGTRSTRALEELADTHIALAPDGGYGWVVLFAAFFCNFVADGVIYPFSTFTDAIAREFHVKVPDVSVASSLMQGFYYLGGPIVCALINRYGFRIIGIIGGVTSAVGLFISSRMLVLPVFIPIYGVLGGLGFGMSYASSVVVVGFYFTKWRALASSIMACGSGIGIIVMPLFVKYILYTMHWRTQFLILGAICATTAVVPLFYRPLRTVQVTKPITPSLKIINETLTILSVDSASSAVGTKSKDNFINKMKKYHNEEFPKASEMHRTSTIFITIPKRDSSESFFVAGGSMATLRRPTTTTTKDDQSAILSTSAMEEQPSTRCRRCCKRCYKCWRCGKGAPTNRPMYREDILYGASLALLQPYITERTDVEKDQGRSLSQQLSYVSSNEMVTMNAEEIGFSLSVTRAATQRDIEEQHKCTMCPEAVLRTLSTMLDLSVIKSPAFLCIGFSGFFTNLSLLVPYIYVNKLAEHANLPTSEVNLLLPVLGIANLVGRILCGLLSVIPRCNVIAISYISLCLCGVATSLSWLCHSLVTFYIYVSVFGLTIAAFATLRAPIVVEVLGIEKLTNALGIIMLFHGVAGLIGLPLASAIIKRQSYKYDGAFMFSGVCLLLSGILLIPVKALSRWEKKKLQQKEAKEAKKETKIEAKKETKIETKKETKIETKKEPKIETKKETKNKETKIKPAQQPRKNR